MQTTGKLLKKLWFDEQGGEVLEYALVGGLIVIGCLTAVGLLGGKIKGNWEFFNNGMGN